MAVADKQYWMITHSLEWKDDVVEFTHQPSQCKYTVTADDYDKMLPHIVLKDPAKAT